jgi:hypothetical protein
MMLQQARCPGIMAFHSNLHTEVLSQPLSLSSSQAWSPSRFARGAHGDISIDALAAHRRTYLA